MSALAPNLRIPEHRFLAPEGSGRPPSGASAGSRASLIRPLPRGTPFLRAKSSLHRDDAPRTRAVRNCNRTGDPLSRRVVRQRGPAVRGGRSRRWIGVQRAEEGDGLEAYDSGTGDSLEPAAGSRAIPSPGDEAMMQEAPVYRDSFFDLAFINACRQAFGRVAGWQSPRGWEEGYLGMVEVSHALIRGRSAAQQQAAVLKGFPKVPAWFRQLFPCSDWGAEANARITPLFFSWLVGPCQVAEAEVGGKTLKSAVQIERCRYLATSGCTGMCVNLCKVPTQYFFEKELGMPLTMEPNFEDLSCRMVFGQLAPPLEEDPALKQPCFATCPSANIQRWACPKLQ